MLSVLTNNKLMLKLPGYALLSAVACLPLSANAIDTFESNLQVHGFLSQGVINSEDSNFVNDKQNTSFELTEVGINASYQISPTLRAAGQVVYLNGGNRYAEGARLDYLLLDWSAYQAEHWQANLLFGRFKNYNWLYSSTRDVPHTRPSIVLPQSVYFDGFRDIAVGGDGVALLLKHNDERFGEFEFDVSLGTSNISSKQTEIILSEFAKGDMNHDYDIQGSIYWQPLETQWRLGIAVLDSDFSYAAAEVDAFQNAEISLQRFIVNGLYEAENWEFSVEAFQERFVLDGFYAPNFHQDNLGQGAYVQTRYQLSDDFNLLARAERFFANKHDKNGKQREEQTGAPSYFGFQHDFVLGVTYNVSHNAQIQFEHHWYEGTARLTPVVLPNGLLNDSKNWQTWAVQLMYWF